MNEFKEQLSDLLVNYKEKEIMFEKLTSIYNWPEISYYDEDTDKTDYTPLSVENCSVIDLTDDYMEITCFGDCQECHIIRVESADGELTVSSYEQHEFLDGMEYDEFIEELEC